MSIKKEFNVHSIPKKLAKPWLLKKHYAKRIPSISYAYGLHKNKELVGICTYGTPPSPPLRVGVCGEKYSDKVLELNRLITEDDLPKNALSYFVSKTLKLLPKPKIIISFADKSQGHHGYIYQATNFIYTGLSAKRTDWVVEGQEEKHGITIADQFRGCENRAEKMREKYGDKFKLEKRDRKHRYIYFTGNKKQKEKMKNNLNYEIKDYPKGNNQNYNTGKKLDKQQRLF